MIIQNLSWNEQIQMENSEALESIDIVFNHLFGAHDMYVRVTVRMCMCVCGICISNFTCVKKCDTQ